MEAGTDGTVLGINHCSARIADYNRLPCSSHGGISFWERKASTDTVRLTRVCVGDLLRVEAENVV